MKKIILLVSLILMLPMGAHAKNGIGLLFGPEGEIEVDKFKTDTESFDGDKEDLKKNFGIHAWFEGQPSGNAVFGGRAAFTTAEGDDSENDYRFIDLGIWSRFTLGPGATEISLVGSAGVTYAMLEGSNDGIDLEGSGIGWHILAGPMVSLTAGTLPINLAVFYSMTTIGTLDAELSGDGQSADVEYDDVSVSRILASVGTNF